MFNAANTLPPLLGSGVVRQSFILLLSVAALPAMAQGPEAEQPDAAADASLRFIAPFFTADTLMVVDLDSSAIDPEAMRNWLRDHANADEAGLGPAVQMAEGILTTLRNAGVERIYALAMLEDLPTAGAALLIPCRQPDTVAGLLAAAADQIPKQFNYQVHREAGLVALAPAATWERLRERPAAERHDLSKALQSVSGLPHRLAVAIPERVRAEVAALWPDQLPEQVPLQLSPRQLMEDFRAKAVGWQLPPEPRMTVRVITASAEAAERVAEATERTLAVVAEDVSTTAVVVEDEQVVLEYDADDFGRVAQQLVNPLSLTRGTMQDSNQLKQIGLAMHNYHNTHGHLPPRATANAEGQLLLSWRVMILPFIEQAPYYQQFRLDERWNSTHNLPFAETIPVTYIVSGTPLPAGQTRIRLPQIEGSLWHGEGPPRKFNAVVDGLSNTIAAAIAPASAAVVWTNPEPWELDEANLIESFFGDRESAEVLMMDGSVHVLPRTIDAETLRALLTHQGGEVVERPWDEK